MDRVRFGRALGGGAREAAKAILKAADAAAAPNPAPQSASQNVTGPRQPVRPIIETAARRVVEIKSGTRETTAGLKRGSKRFGEAVWGPFVKLSGVLWLELTGVFFGLFAVTAAVGLWRGRADFHGPSEARHKVWFGVAMLLVFGYFMISSFVRAARRGRRS